jgi:hypothetical protein
MLVQKLEWYPEVAFPDRKRASARAAYHMNTSFRSNWRERSTEWHFAAQEVG